MTVGAPQKLSVPWRFLLRCTASGMLLSAGVLMFLTLREDQGHMRFAGARLHVAAAYGSALLVSLALAPLIVMALLTWWRLTRRRWRALEVSAVRRGVSLAPFGATLPLIFFGIALCIDTLVGASFAKSIQQSYLPWGIASIAWVLLPRLIDPSLRRVL